MVRVVSGQSSGIVTQFLSLQPTRCHVLFGCRSEILFTFERLSVQFNPDSQLLVRWLCYSRYELL